MSQRITSLAVECVEVFRFDNIDSRLKESPQNTPVLLIPTNISRLYNHPATPMIGAKRFAVILGTNCSCREFVVLGKVPRIEQRFYAITRQRREPNPDVRKLIREIKKT